MSNTTQAPEVSGTEVADASISRHVLAVCDRIYVPRQGKVADVLDGSKTSALETVTVLLGGTTDAPGTTAEERSDDGR